MKGEEPLCAISRRFVQIAEEIWVLHAFQKKSKRSVTTPQPDLRLIGERLKRIKEALDEEARRVRDRARKR